MKKDFKGTSNDREVQESKEGLKTIVSEVPSDRYQKEQQIQDVADASSTTTDNSSFDTKRVSAKGSTLKQEVMSKVVTKGLGGAVPEEMVGSYTMSYSGNEGTILGSASYTPVAGQSRSDSRYGKKLDSVAKKINYVASEQVLQEYDESKPLSENPEAVQGYNGTYRNSHARAQKNNGNVPGELMFQRSLDEIKRDQVYYSAGQVVTTPGIKSAVTPTRVPVKNANGVYQYPADKGVENYILERGNYLNRALRVHFNAEGKVDKFYFDTINCNTSVPSSIADQSSSHHLIDMNSAEMDRQIMDSKAGDEKADIWTPLARAVDQPTQTVGLLRDLENITGSEVFMSYKKSALAHSYQLNRAAKDGMKTYTPMVEALYGLVMNEQSSATASQVADPINTTFTADASGNLWGTANMMIKAYDSPHKYKTKADLLIQPRSFKMHLQTADNNMNPLRVNAEFVQTVNNREVFSSIDREYDPLMPVCISDKEAIIHPYDFNDLYSFTELNTDGSPKFKQDPFKYMYSDLRNNYVVTAACPLLEGIHNYLNSQGWNFRNISGDKEIVIPMIHSTCFFSLWSLIVLASTPFILNARINSMRDVLYYQKNIGEYPFHQLIDIKNANPMNAVNYENDDYQMPIKVRQMLPSVSITWVLPELFWPFKEQTTNDKYQYVLPWYFNEKQFSFSDTNALIDGTESAMSYPSVRSGVRFGYLDDIFSMSERDIRLCLDRLTNIPLTVEGAGNQGVYKYSQSADGIPFVTMAANDFTLKKFLSLPRELGNFAVAPYGLLSFVGTYPNYAYEGPDTPMFGQSSYILKFWHGKNALTFDPTTGEQMILQPTSINIDRATAYVQDWDSYKAVLGFDKNVQDYGWVPSLGNIFDSSMAPIFGRGSFIPFTNGVNEASGEQTRYTDKNLAVLSLQKALWTRVQMLPMAISPFDMCSSSRKAGEDSPKVDPFDFLYYFGLAGFRASDYREDVYNRVNQVVNQGFSFLTDPFIKDSPIFKESVKFTQSENNNALSH